MAALLIVAHAPLASALADVARHTFPDCGGRLRTLDVSADEDLEGVRARVDEALAATDDEVLVLTDCFGATPTNASLLAADGLRQRVVAGVNVPMLWRVLCYGHLPLAELVARAADGGRQGVMQVASPRRQNQGSRPNAHDPDAHSDQ